MTVKNRKKRMSTESRSRRKKKKMKMSSPRRAPSVSRKVKNRLTIDGKT